MNRLLKRCFVTGLMAGAMLVSIATLASALEFDRNPSLAPSDLPRFKAGDALTVSTENASLMVGSDAISNLTRGQGIVVVEVRGSWIGTSVLVGGQQKSGWVQASDFVRVAQPAQRDPQAYTALKPIEPQAARTSVGSRFSGGSDYNDDYLIGYYVRHETDPNIHVWEPWRHSR